MDNNMNTAFSSTPHKPHYIPEFYHHFYPSKEQQILNSSSAASSPMSTMLYTSNLNQSEENDDNTDVETNQNDTNDDDKEPMFEKPLTPSDVGKLNRLVIPKQYAEKYFPLCGGGGGDSGGDKGLLLSFEDELGKFWRFRYSYWNSSQSYVLTKGWSRYVKEKRLDAGDIVLFERHRRDGERLFIGWRRRRSPEQDSGGGGAAQVSSGGNNTNRVFYSAPHPYPVHHNPHYQHHQYHHHHQHHQIPAVPYQPDCIHAGSSPAAHNQTTTFNGNNNNSNNSSKILRLFGVNLQCQSADHESEPSTPDGSSLLSQGPPPPLHHNFYPDHAYHSEYHHMDYASSRDVKPMRNRRG